VIDSNLLDSSVWISYLFEGENIKEIETEKPTLLSVLSLFEIKTRLTKKQVEPQKIKEKLEFIKKRAILIDTNTSIAEKASEIAIKHNIPAIDSLIYATAILNKAKLITLDNDFRGLPDAIVL
jgi:predicted nucleic acid-binding protein